MNSRISAGSTVVDSCFCQLNSSLRHVGKNAVKKRKQNFIARLTKIEPCQRLELSHPGPEIVNRECGTKASPRVGCSDLKLFLKPFWFLISFGRTGREVHQHFSALDNNPVPCGTRSINTYEVLYIHH
jgi:hypothetical protein